MSKYFSTMLNNLNNTIERRTRLNKESLGNEALYDCNNNLLISTSSDLVNDGKYLSETLSQKLDVVMCGGGHIGLAVYNLSLFLGWNVTIIEDRSDFCTPEKYPKANLIIGDYEKEIEKLNLTSSAVIIATRGHKHDKTCLEATLLKKCRYVGMIGSKSKVHETKKAIYSNIQNGESNILKEDLESIYSPIGLDIKAQTPEEIAISIVAEIIQVTKESKKQLEVDVALLKRLAKENGNFVVSRIVEKSGSAPREQGSTMVVFSNGEIQGTVGGGAVENRVIEDSKKLLSNKEKRAQLFTHNLSNTKASELGMICGGSVKVLLTKFTS